MGLSFCLSIIVLMKKEMVKYLVDEALVEIESGLRDIWVNGSSSDNEAHCWIDPDRDISHF